MKKASTCKFQTKNLSEPRPAPLNALEFPRFAGVPTFMRLPHITDARRLDVALVGVPFDCGTSYRPGRLPGHFRRVAPSKPSIPAPSRRRLLGSGTLGVMVIATGSGIFFVGTGKVPNIDMPILSPCPMPVVGAIATKLMVVKVGVPCWKKNEGKQGGGHANPVTSFGWLTEKANVKSVMDAAGQLLIKLKKSLAKIMVVTCIVTGLSQISIFWSILPDVGGFCRVMFVTGSVVILSACVSPTVTVNTAKEQTSTIQAQRHGPLHFPVFSIMILPSS
jgi:hypothetical protein